MTKMNTLPDLIQTLQRSRAAFAPWAALDKLARTEALLKFANLCQEHRQELAGLESLETGVPVAATLKYSIDWTIRWLNQTAKDLLSFEPKPEVLSATHGTAERWLPRGPMALICGQSFPFRGHWERLAPALGRGNTVILKASRHNFRSTQKSIELWQQCAPNADVLQLLFLDNLSEVEILCQHPAITTVVYFGSADTAAKLHKNLGHKSRHFSCGGRNLAILLSEALSQPFDRISETLLLGNSQTGYNPQKIYCLEKDFPEWEKAFLKLAPQNPTPAPSPDFHPDFRAKVEQAMGEGGKVLGPLPGSLTGQTPVVIYGLPYCSEMQTEEYKFPLLILNQVKYQHEFAKWINVSETGVLASIWGPPEKATKIASQLQTANVFINCWIDKAQQPLIASSSSLYGETDLSPHSPLWFRNQKSHIASQ